MQRRSLSSS